VEATVTAWQDWWRANGDACLRKWGRGKKGVNEGEGSRVVGSVSMIRQEEIRQGRMMDGSWLLPPARHRGEAP